MRDTIVLLNIICEINTAKVFKNTENKKSNISGVPASHAPEYCPYHIAVKNRGILYPPLDAY